MSPKAKNNIPRDKEDDYSPAIVSARQEFARNFNNTAMDFTTHFNFDPKVIKGNCENFIGVAQVPIGLAGPIAVNGENARGEFLIPLATTEGTLVASYNRGMKLINSCGGVRCSVSQDAMQRAPVFVFDHAPAARDFVLWVHDHEKEIREVAESTSSIIKLFNIDPILAIKFAFLRFNYSTGDAAGQNMVGKATLDACNWMRSHYKGIKHFYLESNIATDKKSSQINIMRTRGKRVTAEITIPGEILMEHMRVQPQSIANHYSVANVGALISGANNNGLQAANAITALFIATGQDVANVAESSAGIFYAEITGNNDLYVSITIPSLIVATYGGGTGLPTQKECLELLDCYGKGKVKKLAEIIAGCVLAGEISLAAAISSSDWVEAHERMGRNRQK